MMLEHFSIPDSPTEVFRGIQTWPGPRGSTKVFVYVTETWVTSRRYWAGGTCLVDSCFPEGGSRKHESVKVAMISMIKGRGLRGCTQLLNQLLNTPKDVSYRKDYGKEDWKGGCKRWRSVMHREEASVGKQSIKFRKQKLLHDGIKGINVKPFLYLYKNSWIMRLKRKGLVKVRKNASNDAN